MKARATLVLLLGAPAALVYACGGDGGVGLDGGNDVTLGGDTAAKDGSTNETGTDTGTGTDGSTSDAASDSGATDSSSSDASDGGVTSFGCKKPSDCTSGFCCGTAVFNGGTLPNCNLADASSTCTATCNSSISSSCNATDTLRICVAKTECLDAGSGYTQCCTVPIGDAAASFCWNSTFAGFAGGTCL